MRHVIEAQTDADSRKCCGRVDKGEILVYSVHREGFV